jgi:hypothetical protein
VDLLKRTGKVVKLKLYRYQKGLKFQQMEVIYTVQRFIIAVNDGNRSRDIQSRLGIV